MRSIGLILVAAVLSGGLLALALPPSDLWWLGPMCLAPVLATVSGKGLLKGFLGGILTPAVTCALVQTGWIVSIPGGYPSPKWIMVGCGFFGFLITIVSCVASESRSAGWRRIWMLASLAVLLELILFQVLPAHLALTQHRAYGMLMLASVGGIWLPSLVLWAANAGIAEAIRNQSLKGALLPVACVLAVYALGLFMPNLTGHVTTVAAIQTMKTAIPDLRRLNAEAKSKGAELAVWPEFSGMEAVVNGDTAPLRALSREAGQAPFVTTFRDSALALPHNAAALFNGGWVSALYFKRKVFGGESTMHAPGNTALAVQWKPDSQLGLNICYDSCYPRVIAETAGLSGVGLIALPTIDPDADNCFIAAVHAAFTPFRAAEQGIAIVRADGGAFSEIVDGAGRVVAWMPDRREGVLVARVSLERRWTLYSMLGDWVLYVCGAILIWTIGAGLVAQRRRSG